MNYELRGETPKYLQYPNVFAGDPNYFNELNNTKNSLIEEARKLIDKHISIYEIEDLKKMIKKLIKELRR